MVNSRRYLMAYENSSLLQENVPYEFGRSNGELNSQHHSLEAICHLTSSGASFGLKETEIIYGLMTYGVFLGQWDTIISYTCAAVGKSISSGSSLN